MFADYILSVIHPGCRWVSKDKKSHKYKRSVFSEVVKREMFTSKEEGAMESQIVVSQIKKYPLSGCESN